MKQLVFSGLLLPVLGLFALSCTQQQHDKPTFTQAQNLSQENARAIKAMTTRMVSEPFDERLPAHNVVRDAKTAVAVAEALAFAEFGEKEIREERPYNVFLVDNYWVITGTPDERPLTLGGVFEVVIQAQDGRVLRLTHGE